MSAPQPLPDEVPLDGVEDFLFTCCATTSAWPHEPAALDFHATEGRSWRVTLDGAGARSTVSPCPLPTRAARTRPAPPARGTASELVRV